MLKATVAIVVGILCIILVTHIGVYHKTHTAVPPKPLSVNAIYERFSEHLIDSVNGDNIASNLRIITEEPHVAGTKANYRVAEKIAKLWKDAGLQDVHFIKYEVLLSYPDYNNPNHVTIFDAQEQQIFKTSGVSPVIIQEEQGAPGAGIQWVAYSANGTAEGDVVYCHHGRVEDFKKLQKLGVSLEGKIALIRYSHGFRGDKVRFAQQYGAIGAILYSDPAEVAKNGISQSKIYPATEWMPEHGVQRGSIMRGDGDPLSPIYPSKPDLYPRRTIEDAKKLAILPSIPVLPISYSDAYEILKRMKGNNVPQEWQGGINVTYKLGPGLTSGKVRIDVNAKLEKREIKNIVGYIHGAEDPDHYVILGNHYDAWVYGSLDPNSGTATLAEVARAMVQTINETNWRPARTIMFCNWDGEEHGIIGSTEFTEEFLNILTNRAVIYLNVDTIYANQSFYASAMPTLYHIAVESAKKVPNPMKSERKRGRMTVYDTWIKRFPGKLASHPEFPELPAPGGGSDHVPFATFLGVPVINFRYRNISWEEYPLYHSLYETPFTNEHIFDTNHMAVHRSIGQYWAEVARAFADPPVLPLNVSMYAQTLLEVYVPDLRNTLDSLKTRFPQVKDGRAQVTQLIRNCQEFAKQAEVIDNEVKEILKKFSTDYLDQRRIKSINDRLVAIDRCFVNPWGMAHGPSKRHVLYSISDKDSYSAKVMPGVYDEIANIIQADNGNERNEAGKELARQISIIQISVKCATNTLLDMI